MKPTVATKYPKPTRRRFTFPEEERRRLTTAPASGVRRFKSDSVVDLEAYRRKREVCEQVGLRG